MATLLTIIIIGAMAFIFITVMNKLNGPLHRCPYCKTNLEPIINRDASAVLEVFRRMGQIGNAVTMETARKKVIEQGTTCSNCGKTIKW